MITYSEYCRRYLGPGGRYWATYGGLAGAYAAMHAAYDAACGCPAYKTVGKHIRRASPPHKIKAYYAGSDGWHRVYADVSAMTHHCISILVLRHIQSQIHDWLLACDIPPEDRDMLEQRYISQEASRDQITRYLAGVQYYVLRRA